MQLYMFCRHTSFSNGDRASESWWMCATASVHAECDGFTSSYSRYDQITSKQSLPWPVPKEIRAFRTVCKSQPSPRLPLRTGTVSAAPNEINQPITDVP